MKRYLLILMFCSVGLMAAAQTDKERYEQWKQQQRGNYDSYKQEQRVKYEEFRKKANEEYANFLREHWTRRDAEPPVPVPTKPKPPRPKEAPVDKIPSSDPVPYDEVVPLGNLPLSHDLPPLPIIDEPEENTPITKNVMFYGTGCTMQWNESMRFKLANLDGETLANAWMQMATDAYDGLLRDIIQSAERMKLNDWGVVMLVRSTAEELMGKGASESVFLQDFLLTQLGAKVLLARDENRLYLLTAMIGEVYNYPYFDVDGEKYYWTEKSNGKSLMVMGHPFPETQTIGMALSQPPQLAMNKSVSKVLGSKKYPLMKASVSTNKNLIDFYNDYPLTAYWDLYSQASLSDEVKAVLYPKLRQQLKGLSKAAAADRLLNFVQTCFEYATDDEQFGYERPLFADESVYYPYNDCEDRSIFYSILVRDLLELDVVLLHFHDHLATAVKFPTKVEGDYLDLDDGRYIVCDPTYIGAPVGTCMPQYKTPDTEVKVVRL